MRRPEPAEQDDGAQRQMEFLPEKMRQPSNEGKFRLEEEHAEEELSSQGAATEETRQSTPSNRRRGQKRKDDDFQEADDSEEEPATNSSKRRRRTNAPKEEPSRTLRRQSTMTQLADGRRPSMCADEPEFKPVKRRSRVSWSGTGGMERERDTKQRTLTQMIPGMGRLSKEELDELSDLDADLEDDEFNKDAVSQTLIEQGLLEVDAISHMSTSGQLSGEMKDDDSQIKGGEQRSESAALHTQSSVAVQSVEPTDEDHDEEDYHPTQFIDAPTLRTRQTPRRVAAEKVSNKLAKPAKSITSKFSLLSTPERRRIFEIPSSQSPAESVLSTQDSPQILHGPVLRERDMNAIVIAETPSKRRRVTFEEPTIHSAPPARLRRFESTIQDSEDEDESDLESDAAQQDLVESEEQAVPGEFVGADAQAVLNRIDLACASTANDILPDSQESSDAEEPIARREPYQPSPELGESWAPLIFDDEGPDFESYQSSRRGANSQSRSSQDAGALSESYVEVEKTNIVSQLDFTTQAPVLATDIPSTPPTMQPQPDEDLPSTPMVLRDESSDEEEAEPGPSPPGAARRVVPELPSTLIHQSTDLDGEPIQVPRSPSADRETQHSHSSKAEQQLQHEWLSYSQYVHVRAPDSSSMHAAVDAFSYNATPRASKAGAVMPTSRIQHSQATTVDEVTPKKNRTQRVISANTTPHRSAKSQPLISPEKPPSLFIPSSFPSPSRAAMEGWSSPVAARTQNMYGSSQVMGSLEDFSIPLPPPTEDD